MRNRESEKWEVLGMFKTGVALTNKAVAKKSAASRKCLSSLCAVTPMCQLSAEILVRS